MASSWSPDDFDKAVRTVWGEARGEAPEGQRAVAAVIANRAKSSGKSLTDTVLAPNQFEPWSRDRQKLESLDPNSEDYQRIATTIWPVLYGVDQDPTNGATHFYSPKAQAALGRQPPSWDNGSGVDLGTHRFFNLGYKAPASQPAAPPSSQPTLSSALTTGTTPMATDPLTGQWTPEEVIKSRYTRANQFWDTPRSTSPLGALAEGLGGFFSTRESAAADDLVRQNQAVKAAALQSAANEKDVGALGKKLLSTGIPGLADQGMGYIAHEAAKRADMQNQLEMQKQKFDFERKLQIDLKRQEMQQITDLLRANGMLPPSAVTAPSLPGQTAPGQPGPAVVLPPAAPTGTAPLNPNEDFIANLLPEDAHKAPSAAQKAATALILGEKGKAVDALNEKGEKLTEGQVKDASYAERMIRAEAGLREVVPTDKSGKFLKYDPTKNMYRFLPDWNVTNSNEWQQYSRNAREGIAAILRKDTGAAVTKEEWDWYFPMYYPQPGDSAEVVRDKQMARISVARGLRNGSGPAFDQMFPNFNAQLRERLLKSGADLTPPQETKAKPASEAPASEKYAQIKRNPKTGEMAGYNSQTGQWEIIKVEPNEPPPQQPYKNSIANRGKNASFPEPQDMQ